MTKEIKKTTQTVVYDDPSKNQTLPQAAVQATLDGNWQAVSVPDKIVFVKSLCDSLGIPLVMNPFLFIQTRNGLKFFAPAAAFHMIGEQKKISCEIRSQSIDKDLQLYEVAVRASMPDGRFSDNFAAVTLKNLGGEDYANAKMKCVTKAQRRAIKSLIGLPIPDEDDIKYDGEVVPLTPLPTPEPLPTTPKAAPAPSLPPTPPANIPPALTDKEIIDWRTRCADLMLGKYGPFANNKDSAAAYVKEKTGRMLKDLNAAELEQLWNDVQSEFFHL